MSAMETRQTNAANTARITLGLTYQILEKGIHNSQMFLGLEGSRGTAKTRSILTILLARALRVPKSTVLLVRSARSRLSQSVLRTLEEQVFPAFGRKVPGASSRETRFEYRLPNGSTLVPIGLDDVSRLQSVEGAWMYLAEATEISSLELCESLAGCLRQELPEKDAQGNPVPPRQIILDCNPSFPAHWLNKKLESVNNNLRRVFVDKDKPNRTTDGVRYFTTCRHNLTPVADPTKWKRILTNWVDNPGYFDARNWCWTKLGYDYYTRNLKTLSGFLKRRWCDGEWAAASGSVFPEFNEDVHVIKAFRIPDDWPIYVFLDPGYDHPCAILWIAIAPNGNYYVIDELHRPGLGVEKHAHDIMEKNIKNRWWIRGYYADPQNAFSRTAFNPKTIAQQFAACNPPLHFSPWPRAASLRDGKSGMVEALRTRLVTGRFKVFPHCQHTVEEFQSWMYKRNAQGAPLQGDDQYEDKNNDALDCIMGAVALPLAPVEAGESGGVQVVDSDGEEDL